MNETDGLFIVADGMGGHRGGDHASRLAIETAALEFSKQQKAHSEISYALGQAMSEAAKAVFEAGHGEEALWGMGTTLSALHITDGVAHIVHIGDTRIYCLREHELIQLTSDHSLVNEQVQAGIISEEEARVSPLRNIITRALGQSKVIFADQFSWPLKEGDVFLLCSDGLTTMVSDQKIAKILTSFEVDLSAEMLIKEANNNGGEDNITVIIVRAKA